MSRHGSEAKWKWKVATLYSNVDTHFILISLCICGWYENSMSGKHTSVANANVCCKLYTVREMMDWSEDWNYYAPSWNAASINHGLHRMYAALWKTGCGKWQRGIPTVMHDMPRSMQSQLAQHQSVKCKWFVQNTKRMKIWWEMVENYHTKLQTRSANERTNGRPYELQWIHFGNHRMSDKCKRINWTWCRIIPCHCHWHWVELCVCRNCIRNDSANQWCIL